MLLYTCIIRCMSPVHVQVLDAACTLADEHWRFRIADLARALPHLNPATVRTHVASRCCVNAPPNHQSRHRYFRAVGRGVYRVERAVRRRPRRNPRRPAWQDRMIAAAPRGVDTTLIVASLKKTPTERLETMRRAAQSLQAMRPR